MMMMMMMFLLLMKEYDVVVVVVVVVIVVVVQVVVGGGEGALNEDKCLFHQQKKQLSLSPPPILFSHPFIPKSRFGSLSSSILIKLIKDRPLSHCFRSLLSLSSGMAVSSSALSTVLWNEQE